MITDENARSEDCNHTSGGVVVTKKKEQLCPSLGMKEGSPKRGSVRGGMRGFAVYLWQAEGWTTRNEALEEEEVKQASTTRIPGHWLAMPSWSRNIFRNSWWFKEQCMFIEAPAEGISTCRFTGPKGEVTENV